MRLDRWFLDPLRLWPLVLAVQAAVWYAGFPQRPTIPLAAPRFWSETAVIRFLAFCECLVAGLVLGHYLASIAKRPPTRKPLVRSVATWQRLAFVGVLIAALGELAYVRAFLLDPSQLVRGFLAGDFAAPSGAMNAQQITGLTSLNNIYLAPAAIYALLSFNPDSRPDRRRRFGWRLGLLGAVVMLHAFVLSARMFAVHFMAIVAAAYLLARPRTARLRTVIGIAAFVLLLIWGNATLRDGRRFALENGVGLLHPDTQQYVRDTLMQGYFGADFNNTLVYLNCTPTHQYVTSTMFATVLRKLGKTLAVPQNCYPEEESQFGTVNTIALWWMDLGWYAGLFALLVGAFVSYAYCSARSSPFTYWTAIFFVAYPGVIASIRMNYFALTIFVLPTAYLVAAAAFIRLLPLLSVRPPFRRVAITEAVFQRAAHPPTRSPLR